jgi:hypothetical protein
MIDGVYHLWHPWTEQILTKRGAANKGVSKLKIVLLLMNALAVCEIRTFSQ